MGEILNRSQGGLRIFDNAIEVDYSLPKYNKKLEEVKEKLKTQSGLGNQSIYGTEEDRIKRYVTESVDVRISKEEFEAASISDVIAIVDKKNSKRRDDLLFYLEQDSEGMLDTTVGTEKASNNEEGNWVSRNIKKWLRRFVNDEENKEIITLDVTKFFESVKLASKDSVKRYVNRVEPYLIAIKNAQEMGQVSLVDDLVGRMVIEKFESVLMVNGLEYKITEGQIVDFIKKTEKGVSLSYIKNFTRPIPKEVQDKKIEADKLEIFDNYCVLYYDPEGTVYKKEKRPYPVRNDKRITNFVLYHRLG